MQKDWGRLLAKKQRSHLFISSINCFSLEFLEKYVMIDTIWPKVFGQGVLLEDPPFLELDPY